MKRRCFLLACWLAPATLSRELRAQQPVATIGVLNLAVGRNTPAGEALRNGFRNLGYMEGRNIRLEYRVAEGRVDRLPQLAQELVRRSASASGTRRSNTAYRQCTFLETLCEPVALSPMARD